MRFIKPLDEELVMEVVKRHRAIVTLEENAVMGGAGSAVGEVLAAHGVLVPLLQLGIPDRFIEHGSRDTCLAAAGLDLAGIGASIEKWWTVEKPGRVRSVRGV
jgi:1-deoxy-D-xylulose-5-phosphate synthase